MYRERALCLLSECGRVCFPVCSEPERSLTAYYYYSFSAYYYYYYYCCCCYLILLPATTWSFYLQAEKLLTLGARLPSRARGAMLRLQTQFKLLPRRPPRTQRRRVRETTRAVRRSAGEQRAVRARVHGT
eukprot:3007284-Rhodomonas_salina.1